MAVKWFIPGYDVKKLDDVHWQVLRNYNFLLLWLEVVIDFSHVEMLCVCLIDLWLFAIKKKKLVGIVCVFLVLLQVYFTFALHHPEKYEDHLKVSNIVFFKDLWSFSFFRQKIHSAIPATITKNKNKKQKKFVRRNQTQLFGEEERILS